jgi:RND family efflux transporter MFP subunit
MTNSPHSPEQLRQQREQLYLGSTSGVACLVLTLGLFFVSCGRNGVANAGSKENSQASLPAVGVTKLTRKPMARYLTLSSELVPFQEIDVFAKESGFVSKLYVDYGTRVKTGQLMAVLEIPELQAQLEEDKASIKSFADQVNNAEHQLGRVEAQSKVYHLEFTRLNGVASAKPGLVAQQEVDDAEGKDLASQAQVEAAKSQLQSAQSQSAMAQSKLAHDQALYDYSKITAPFSGVVTQRYANLGTLMQAGTSSSTQVLPLVKLSQEDLFRLTIPVPESYVRYIKVGDPVDVRVSAVNRDFPGKVVRFSSDVAASTRTMHTEVDVPNPQGILIPGVYAEATLTLDRIGDALVVPLQAVNQEGDHANVMVVGPGNKIEERQITLGIQTDSYAEVLSGVGEGEQIVVSDRGGLKPGQEVRPQIIQVAEYKGKS